MIRLLWLLPLAIAAAPTVRAPLPFDHAAHAPAFERQDVGCVTCHPVGAPVGTRVAPQATCHGCHLGEAAAADRRAPRTCESCHAVRAELQPASHGLEWLARHGLEARASARECRDCHATSACRDCHERRGPVVANPHPPAFSRTHGIEARLDPASCSQCHALATCEACHTTGVRPW